MRPYSVFLLINWLQPRKVFFNFSGSSPLYKSFPNSRCTCRGFKQSDIKFEGKTSIHFVLIHFTLSFGIGKEDYFVHLFLEKHEFFFNNKTHLRFVFPFNYSARPLSNTCAPMSCWGKNWQRMKWLHWLDYYAPCGKGELNHYVSMPYFF